MDLLERINALTDDQLRMIADRDDASGVLASYRLAELRGVPAPDRNVVVMGDGYAIVAQDGKISRIATEGVVKVIRQEGDQYCVYSEDGSQSFGCYDTMDAAEERLREIHYFDDSTEKAVREGSFVSWDSIGGTARGQVEHVMTEGTLGVPGSSFSIDANEDDPAVLIRIWRPDSDGKYQATETLVGHRMSTLTQIQSLKSVMGKATKREDGEDFPAEAFAYVPDPERVSTWKLRLWDSLSEKETRAQVARAVQALSPAGFRGNRVEIPAEDLAGVKAKVLAAWRRVNEADAEPPAVLLQKETFKPPAGVQEAAQRALEWIREGHAGDGFTDVGRARAAQLARGGDVSEETIQRISSYFSRHVRDQEAEGFNAGEDGFPSPGRVAWDAWGGDPGKRWADAIAERLDRAEKTVVGLAKQRGFVRKSDERQFTLGPLYVPDFMDAHGEWTDADELQPAVWEWVKGGDRRIYLQHDREVEAGEWVEVMTMPQAWTVTMRDAAGNEIGQVTYPPNTVFLGVQWNDKAWALIKAGKLRGYSIGGFSDRVMADLPLDAARDGVAVPDAQ